MKSPKIKHENMEMVGTALATIIIRDGFGEAVGVSSVTLARTIRMACDLSEDDYIELLEDMTAIIAKHDPSARRTH